MIQNKKLFIFVLLSILIQSYLIYKSDMLYSSLPFTDGVPISPSFVIINRYLINWYLPVVAISFYISGYMEESLSKYGKFLIVRSYSKTLWVLNQFSKLVINLFLFASFQLISFWVGPFLEIRYSFDHLILLISLYYLTLLTLFCIQIYLELFLSQQLSLLIVNGYIILSIVISSSFSNGKTGGLLNYFLLPNFGMGLKNGLSSVNAFQPTNLNYLFCLIILITLIFIIVALTIRRFNRVDIL